MRRLVFITSIIVILTALSSPGEEKLGEKEPEEELKALQERLEELKGFSDIPYQELRKAEIWINQVKQSLRQENTEKELTYLQLKKVSFQIELLNAIVEELNLEKKVFQMNDLLYAIRNQIQQLKDTNEKVKEEIKRLEKENETHKNL
ncbi:MAG: hypothetical protein KatS3mg078_0200 [Deltaproteobacteria bacterium]|jgi:chromosome segregation ATPase|nr:MAG: hypothetical protein KatS3mg078_0200 [Deltaproteobacteria bacterium]